MTIPTTIRRAAVLALVTTCSLAPTLAVAADPSPAVSPGAATDAKTVTTKSGLQYTDIAVGKGNMPKKGQTVAVKYAIYVNDKKVESSPPDTNFEFILGRDQALKGIEEGVSTMQVGGKRKLIVPPDLAYGAQGQPPKIGPNATLVFVIDLLSVN